jgi:phage gp36-like protein
MAAYVTAAELLARIPTAVQLQALDDNADGTADTGRLTSILDDASRWVDARLHADAELSSPYPALAAQAALARACWLVFERAGRNGKDNPALDEMQDFRDRLDAVAKGEGELDAAPADASLSGNIANPEDDEDDPSLFQDPTSL